MRAEVVEKLVLAAAVHGDRKQLHGTQTGNAVGFLAKLWLDSRAALAFSCVAMGIFAGALADGVSGVFGRQYAVIVAAGVVTPVVLVWFPWLYLRWRMRSRQQRAVQSLERVFAEHRVTDQEWVEAKRLIRATHADFLRFGIAERLDALCVL